MRRLTILWLLSGCFLVAATGESSQPTGEEVVAWTRLNQLRTDYRRGQIVILESIRSGGVRLREGTWARSAKGKIKQTIPPPVLLNPTLSLAAGKILDLGTKLPEAALLDASQTLREVAYPDPTGALVLMARDAPDIITAYARACTVVIRITETKRSPVIELAGHEACLPTWQEIGVAVRSSSSGTSLCIVLGKGPDMYRAGGVVYRDGNRNGQYDAGEGVAGVVAKVFGQSATTGPSGAWQVATRQSSESLILSIDGNTQFRPLTHGMKNVLVDWNAPGADIVKRIDQLIIEAEKAPADTDKRTMAQASLLLAARLLSLDDARAARVKALTEPVFYRYETTREKILETMGESVTDATKLITARRKEWGGAMPEFFKEAAALPKLREAVASCCRMEPAAATKQGLAIQAQLTKAMASSVEPAFLVLYRDWYDQIATHLSSDAAAEAKEQKN